MGLKYFSRFTDVDGNGREVRFFNDSFSGTPTEWINSAGAITYHVGDSDSVFPDQPIIATQAQIGLILEEIYDLSEFVFDRKTFFVQIVDTDFDKIKWSGWVEPWNAAHKYVDPPHEVALTASCGLAHLSRKKYVNPSNSFRKTGLMIIQECLGIIEAGELALRLSTHMVENSFSGDSLLGLTSFEIDTQRYYDDNGEAMYCDVIVNDILNHFNAELVQWDNKWVIRAVVDHATGIATDYHDIGDTSGSLAWPRTYTINSSQAVSLIDGQLRVLAPINKYRTEIDFGQQTPFFENGNMLLWNESGLIGWDFSHMAKGNPGWEQFQLGGESNKSVLKINGKSPQPYRKRKKVKLFKKLTNQAINIAIAGVGAGGALFNKPVLKGSWYDVEPSEWIESPGGSISKADKSVTITFEYETEAFSSDILISIRIPVTLTNGEVRQFWVDPNSNPALAGSDKTNWSLDSNFHLIRVQPVDRGSLINKGDINALGNPNYPAASTANWTWTITGVPAGEYRKIGGINGVNVENGDLIIARVPNAGGTQEAVGENFEIVSIRNKTHKGTFSGTIALSSTFITTSPDVPYPDKVYVRFYKMADDEGLPGDWYKIYNLNGVLEGFVPSTESSKYATTLERGSKTDEEAETIQLITGDYTPWYIGSWRKPGSNDVTSSWRRRPFLNEGMSIYRAMMLDRLCMTSRPLSVFEGEIKLRPDQADLSYLHTLVFIDQADKKYRIVRYSFQEYLRIATVTAVEVKYEEIPKEQLRQDSYIPGSHQLNTIPGQGDGIYPSKQDSTNGRLNAEDMPLTAEEVLEAMQTVGRTSALFEEFPPLVFVAGELGTDSVDMEQYLSEAVLYNFEEEEDDEFDFRGLSWEVIKKPSWVLSQTVVFMNVTATANPPSPGTYSILFKVFDPPGEDEDTGESIPEIQFHVEVEIPIIVYPKTKYTYTLQEVASGDPVLVGPLPGSYAPPTLSEILIAIAGTHDFYQFTLQGGGPGGDAVNITRNQSVPLASSGSYNLFDEEGGYALPEGVYRFYSYTSVGDRAVSRQSIIFVLGDEEYLNKVKFYFASSGSDIAQIDPDGTSVFEDPGAWNPRVQLEDLEHDKAVVRLLNPGGETLFEKQYPLTSPEEEGSYPVFDEDLANPIGRYTVYVEAWLASERIMTRFADFTTIKKVPDAVGGGLQMLAKSSTSMSFSVLGTMNLDGNLYSLPATGWNIGSDVVTELFDWEGDELYEYIGGALVKVDVSKYIGRPSFITYPFPVTFSEYRAFDNLTSLKIAKIHGDDRTFRYIRSRRIGGAAGDIVAVLSADFSFGTLVEIDEDAEVTEPGGNGLLDYKARRAMSEEIIESIKHFDVETDETSLTVNGSNELTVKAKGITLDKIVDLTPRSVLGNGGLIPGTNIIPIKDVFDGIVDGELVWGIAIKDYIEEQIGLSISGTPGRIPKYATVNTLTDSVMFEFDGKIGIGLTAPSELLHVLGNIRVTGSLYSSIITGTAPIAVNSTTRVANLNVDLLDDHEGTYYLDWNNFTNYKSIIAGTGLSGGGILSADRTLSVVYGTTAGTSAQGNDSRIIAGQTAADRWISVPVNYTDINNITDAGVIGWGNTALNRPAPFGSILTFVGNSTTGDLTGGSWLSQILSATTGDWWVRYGQTGTLYQMWTTKQFTQTDVTNWDTAFSWGDHAGLYVPITRQVIAGTGLTGGGVLNADRTFSVSYGTTAGTAAQGNDPRIIAGQSASDRWVGQPIELTDINNIINGGVKGWNNTAANRPTSFGTALTFVGNTSTGNSGSSGFTHQILGATTGDWYVRYGSGATPSWGTTYQLWTTKQFAQTDVNNWNTAFGWGNHAGLYVLISRQIIAGTGLSGGGVLNADRTLSVVYGTTSGTAAQGNDSRITNGQTAYDRWVSSPVNYSDINTITQGGISSWGNTASNRPAAFGTIFSFVGNSSNGNYSGGTWMSQLMCATTEDWYVRYGQTGTIYQMWTTKQFNSTDVSNWNTAYGWGNHSGLYVPITRQILNGAGITGGGQLNADRTLSLTTTGVGAGTYRSVTVDVYGRISAGTNPTTLTGYGLDSTVYTKTQVDALIPTGYLTGSGTSGIFAKFNGTNVIGNSTVTDTGSEVNFANSRSFGVEGPAAMRNYLHVHGYQSNGTASNHGSLVIHNDASATPDASAAIEIRSTSRGFLPPRMTQAQRLAIASPAQGLIVFQTNTVGASDAGLKMHYAAGFWVGIEEKPA